MKVNAMRQIRQLFEAIAEHKVRTRSFGKALSISVINQVVSSGTNFALGIYLVRALTPTEFGLYGIGFATCLFYAGIGNALLLTQMVVHTPDKSPDDRLPYAGRMFLLVSLFCVATVILISLILQLGNFVWASMAQYSQFVIAITAASVAYLLKDFFVRHAYNVRREPIALAVNVAVACMMAVLLSLQHIFKKSFDEEMALWIYAVSNVSGAALGFLLSWLPITVQRNMLCADLREALHGGKWASVTNLVYFARTQAHTIVVASLLGPVGVAKLNAARLLVTPAIMLSPTISQVAMPRLAAARELGVQRMIKLGRIITFALLSVSLLYCAVLLGGYDLIVATVINGNYQGMFLITALWCLWACLASIRNGAELVAQVLKRFKGLSGVNSIGALVSLVATYVLTTIYGLPGALFGLVLGKFVMIIFLFRISLFRKNS